MMVKNINIPKNIKVRVVRKNNKTFLYIKTASVCFLFSVPERVFIQVQGQLLRLEGRKEEVKNILSTFVRVVSNAFGGAIQKYKVALEIKGPSFSFFLKGPYIYIKNGYTHLSRFRLPSGVFAEQKKGRYTTLFLSSFDLQRVADFANSLKALKKQNPYKGSGIFNLGEEISLKKSKKEKE